MTSFSKHLFTFIAMTLLAIPYSLLPSPSLALDTDVYAINPRPNVAILFDTSDSMNFGIYESSINYKNIYSYACEQTDGEYTAYCRHNPTAAASGIENLYYKMFIDSTGALADLDPDEIVLIKGNTGVAVNTTGETTTSLTGDPGNPMINWDFTGLNKTGVKLVNGKLESFVETPRLTTNGEDQTIWLDGAPLPLDRGITLDNMQIYEDSTTINLGLTGLMQAPGYHFTGYSSNYAGNPTADGLVAINGDNEVYFLASANWVYMMLAYQLHTAAWDNIDDGGDGEISYNDAKEFSVLRNYSIPHAETWVPVSFGAGSEITSPNYPSDYPGSKLAALCGGITQLDASKIKLHFSDLDLFAGDAKDTIQIRDKETGDTIGTITNASNNDEGFLLETEFIPEGTYTRGLEIFLITDDKTSVGKGFEIDGYSYSTTSSEYKMKPRVNAVLDAILYVIDDTRGSINWALAGFDATGGSDGADVKQPFNPEDANDDLVRENIVVQLEAFAASGGEGGTPLGEALQDIFNHFHDKENDFAECSRQFCIVISHGYPSLDTEWSRMDSGVDISTSEYSNGIVFSSDPSQNPVVDNYLDNVAGYMYTHVFRDLGFGDLIDDPGNLFDNITTHTLSFTQDLPLLEATANEGGGIALSANNGQQVINALRSLAMLAIKSASYVAPVISVDTANKTQSGEWLYMAFFKPTSNRWVGNLKKYKVVKKIKSGNCPGRTEEEWVVTDSYGDDYDAVDCDGQFLETSRSYWSTEVDGGEVIRGGVGGLLRDRVKTTFDAGASYYTGRYIYVLKNEVSGVFPTPAAFNPGNISNEDLGGVSDLERHQIINYIHGYTYDADVSTFDPTSYRYWPLGSFIHSNPNIVHYEDVDGKTYIVIGSNDGMIHVFDDATGNEVVAFIPEDLLGRLREINLDKDTLGLDYKESPLFFVDGQTSYYQEFSDEGKSIPKQLIFGLRRGGSSYYSLNVENSDPSQWTLKWHIKGGIGDFAVMGESWSKMELMPIRTAVDAKTIAGVFGGGYDNAYDDESIIESPDAAKPGSALYIIDILNSSAGGVTLLGKTAYKDAPGLETDDMLYAMPANPAVIPDKYGYLETIYFTDLGAQIWNLDYDNAGYAFDSKPRLVFQSNPGSDAISGEKDGGTLDNGDIGRRMFYSPTITLMGKCDYRDSEGEALNSDTYALVVGTGDRENPNRKDINNRIYMILDTNESTPLNETNLFNVTMDDIDIDNTSISEEAKTLMREYLATTNGWYIKLEDIDDIDDYSEPIYHDGEKILARPVIFSGVAYIPSFTPITEDECHPKGQAKIYALNYCDGTAGVNFFIENDDTSGDESVAKFDYRDRYKAIGESIPSSPKVIIREGKAEIFISVGGGLPTIPSEGTFKPIEVINWREMRN